MTNFATIKRAEEVLSRHGISSWSPSVVSAMVAFAKDETNRLREICDRETKKET